MAQLNLKNTAQGDVQTPDSGRTGIFFDSSDGAPKYVTDDGVKHTFPPTAFTSTLPGNLGTAAVGTEAAAARGDHVHAHGAQSLGDGTMHAAASTDYAGFMSATDKTKLDGIATGAVADHGALSGLSDDDHPQYISHALATAQSDFLVASGSGAFAKQTLSEVQTTLGLGTAAYTASTDYAPTAKGVTGGDSHDHTNGSGAQIDHANLASKGTNSHDTIDTFIASKGVGSGLASLTTGGKVVQDPDNAQVSAAGGKIPIADIDGKLDSAWLDEATTAGVKGIATFDSGDFTVTDGLVTVNDAGISVDHGALTGLGDDDHTQYIRHNLSTAQNDFLVGSSSNTFEKKTLSETLTVLGKGSASGLASLNSSSLVVQDPANATATPTASKIVIADSGGKVDGWVTDATTSIKGKASFDTSDFTVTGGAVTIKDSGIDHDSITGKGTNTHTQIDTFISSKGAASGLASLNSSSKVIENPANATATPGTDKIVMSDGTGKISSSWVGDATTSTKGVASFDTNDFTVTSGAVTVKDSGIDHGSLSGLSDTADHPQYTEKATLAAKGSMYAASAASTPANLTVGADGTYLKANSAATNGLGLEWVPLAVVPSLPVYNVKDYEAEGNDSHDDTVAIQAAIDACSTADGGIVYFPPGRYKITDTLNITHNSVHLMGSGSGYTTDTGDFTQIGGSVIVWRGTSTTIPMILAQPVALGASGTALLGLKITDLSIEGRNYPSGNIAGIGIQIKSAHGWFLQNLYLMDFSVVALDFDVLSNGSIGEAHDTTRGLAERICIRQLDEGAASGIGVRFGGSATANACLNEFRTFQISHANGAGILLNNSDTNEFHNISINRTGSGTGIGVDLKGGTSLNLTARNNVFFSCSAGPGGCTVRGGDYASTYPSLDTHWHDYQVGNGEPLPVIETGANMIFNANGTQNGGSFSTLLGNIPAKQLSTVYTTTANTLQDVSRLSFPVVPNEQWYVEFNLIAQCSSTGGVKYGIKAPAGSLIEGMHEGVGAGSTTTVRSRISALSTATATAAHTTANTPMPDAIRIFVKNSATYGDIGLLVQSTTSGQTTTITAGSTMRAFKVQQV